MNDHKPKTSQETMNGCMILIGVAVLAAAAVAIVFMLTR